MVLEDFKKTTNAAEKLLSTVQVIQNRSDVGWSHSDAKSHFSKPKLEKVSMLGSSRKSRPRSTNQHLPAQCKLHTPAPRLPFAPHNKVTLLTLVYKRLPPCPALLRDKGLVDKGI